MQLSATEIAATPLPFDLIPEAHSPSFTSTFQSSSRLRRHLPSEVSFVRLGQGGIEVRMHGADFPEFKGCKAAQLWMIRAGLGG